MAIGFKIGGGVEYGNTAFARAVRAHPPLFELEAITTSSGLMLRRSDILRYPAGTPERYWPDGVRAHHVTARLIKVIASAEL